MQWFELQVMLQMSNMQNTSRNKPMMSQINGYTGKKFFGKRNKNGKTDNPSSLSISIANNKPAKLDC